MNFERANTRINTINYSQLLELHLVMPITGKYTWDQTQESVTISIPFKGKSLKKVDVFLAESVLKVSHPPFLLDLSLGLFQSCAF